jgi:hypothetical protein
MGTLIVNQYLNKLFLGANLTPNFWIDATSGDDANDGSQSAPWASLNKIYDVPLGAGQTVTVRIKTGLYNKSSDTVVKNSVNNPGLNSVLNLVFEPGCVMDGNRNGYNGFEFSGTNTYITNIYGNGLHVNNYGESTSLSPNGVGNRGTHILYCHNVHCDNCDDGFSSHDNAQMYLYDCSAQNAEKGAVIHVDNAYVEHHRCTFIFKGLTNVVGAGTPTCLFYNCRIIPFANTGIGFNGGTFYNCQIGTLTARFQASFRAFDSFVNVYVDANSRFLLTRCYGKISVRVRGVSPNPPVTVENCVITGPATGQSMIVFSNFDFEQPAKIIFNNNIVESGAFMSVSSKSAGQLVSGDSQFFNNILSGSSAFDADLIAADTETNVVVGNVTADALIGAGNTLNPDDYGYVDGSPAIGAATNGGNCGFAVGEVFLPAEQQIPY